jgi:uncharacterized membrane protein YphA (DoxX/SURF4 family)
MYKSNDRSWAIFFARVVLGLIFLMAGIYKVFQLGPLNHARMYFLPFADTFLPVWSLWTVGTVVPFVELIRGRAVATGFADTPGANRTGVRAHSCDFWSPAT